MGVLLTQHKQHAKMLVALGYRIIVRMENIMLLPILMVFAFLDSLYTFVTKISAMLNVTTHKVVVLNQMMFVKTPL